VEGMTLSFSRLRVIFNGREVRYWRSIWGDEF